jgi:hypothetical protein
MSSSLSLSAKQQEARGLRRQAQACRKRADIADPDHEEGGANSTQKGTRMRNKCSSKMTSGKHATEGGGSASSKRTKVQVCKPASLCKNNKQRNTCRECCPRAFCKHGRQQAQCRDSVGSSFCEYKKRCGRCRECAGSKGVST